MFFRARTILIAPRGLFKAAFSSSVNSSEKWDICAAICVERRPVITPSPDDIQKDFQKHLSEIELERSYKSDHEVRHELDLQQAELLKKGVIDVDATLQQTAQDFADASSEELNQFKFAPRQTHKAKDVRSNNRKLDKHLVLLTKQKIGNKDFYLLPQGFHQDGESLRQTAERVMRESFGKDLIRAQVYSNAPSGFYKYKYPKEKHAKEGILGAKMFIYFARYEHGKLAQKDVEHKWLDREELKQELPTEYHKSLAYMLIDE